MKKIILSAIAITALSFANATETKLNSMTVKTVNINAVMEENVKLQNNIEDLKATTENLKCEVSYNKAMQQVINKLYAEDNQASLEESKSLKNYNNMMFKTIKKLSE
ncbi:hypothetical protein [Polluticaenibacter yanchengensis]|uniref:Uncharacterized protein n=1 Tax=Polluticaenibacter yanchengensis TaxID=3014562 RepID=A0ABT4UG44_9BACT|nr:hypothetical protein [Chitinophagaceae bacterium LY-5]